MERIVVGVDGSPGAQGALEWALEEASVRGAEVEVVAAWSHVPLGGWGPDGSLVTALDAELGRDAAEAAEAAVAKAGDGGVAVHVHVVRDAPAHALVEAARGASLLVVGSRGRGGFKGLLLGSVSQQCVHHAPCPVVVVTP